MVDLQCLPKNTLFDAQKKSTTTIRKRLHSMGCCYKIVANNIVATHNQMVRRVDIVKN